MKRHFSLVLTIASFALAAPAFAASIQSGDLIKGPGDAVYYYGANAKRFVFPTAKTYATWYADFSTIKTITADELGAIPLGGNVTYRPGVKLAKVTTDPKVYAVSANGTLRWVQTETLAASLYGADWAKKVDDIPDPFFINYAVGSPIVNTADYSPSAQTAAATDINTDKKLVTTAPSPTPTPTPTPTSTATTTSMTFTASKTTAQFGDVVTYTAQYNGSSAVSKIELFFDGQLIKTCINIPSCAGDALVPTSGTKPSYVAEGRVTLLTTEVVSKSITVTIAADGASLVAIRVGQSVITSGQSASAIADVDASIAIQRIDISVDGVFVKGCATGARQCQWSDVISGSNGSQHPVFARVLDTLGRTYNSKTINITIGTNDLPGVTVAADKSTIYAGETVNVTVTATDNDGIASIDVLKDGVVLKHCDSAAPCTATTGPWDTAGTVLTFTGRAADSKGNIGTTMDSAAVSVTQR